MSNWFEKNSQSIGRAPLIKLDRITNDVPTVLAKIEGRNSANSVKCRIGVAMINDAESRGLLDSGKEIIGPTRGNARIAPAFVAATRDIPLTLTTPHTMSVERRKRKLLVTFGVRLVLMGRMA